MEKAEATTFNKESLTQVFPVNFAKFLRTPFLQNTSGRWLLKKKIENNTDESDFSEKGDTRFKFSEAF